MELRAALLISMGWADCYDMMRWDRIRMSDTG